jgi:hypothetical protein
MLSFARLVPLDIKTCLESILSLAGDPFDGIARPIQLSQLAVRWGNFKFERGGDFALCYKYSELSHVLPSASEIAGAYRSDTTVFCSSTLSSCNAELKVTKSINGA